MRMTSYRNSILLLLFLIVNSSAWGWGPKGHDIVAAIAEQHLTPKAKKSIQAILDSHSLVYYASWMDQVMKHPEYASVQTWHYANVDKGLTFEVMPRNKKGDVVSAVTDLVEKLKAGGLDPQTEELYLKMLIHLVGDMHCPMHAGHLSDLGGNMIPVKFFSNKTNLHSVWDTALVEAAHKWGYTEWQSQIDRLSDEQKETTVSGGPVEWFKQTLDVCTEVYEYTSPKSVISYDYIAKYTPVIEQQLLRGGHRLAKLLNDIYADK